MSQPALSASVRKMVLSLATAKGRKAEGAFVAEGSRCVCDSLGQFNLRHLFATAEWLAAHPHDEAVVVSRADIERMSQQQSPQPVIAVFDLPEIPEYAYDGKMALALDAVQDPGNLGTIIRLADWFGIRHVIAGAGTADAFAPKVVQATMGALARVCVHRTDNLARTLGECQAPVIGTFLNGRNLYAADISLSPRPVIVMGNEGNGISPEVAAVVSDRILIPSYPPGRPTSESLNVAMASGIIISELSRRIYGQTTV